MGSRYPHLTGTKQQYGKTPGGENHRNLVLTLGPTFYVSKLLTGEESQLCLGLGLVWCLVLLGPGIRDSGAQWRISIERDDGMDVAGNKFQKW